VSPAVEAAIVAAWKRHLLRQIDQSDESIEIALRAAKREVLGEQETKEPEAA
jgi:hypothetical protein